MNDLPQVAAAAKPTEPEPNIKENFSPSAFVKTLSRTSRNIFRDIDEFEQATAELTTEPKVIEIDEYLKSWGLGMYAAKFKEQSIDFETLQMLSQDDIKELIPIIGHRAQLTTQISMLKNIITDAFPPTNKQKASTDEIGDSADIMSNGTIYILDDSEMIMGTEQQPHNLEPHQNKQDTDCELYKLLSSCNEGKGLLLRYESVGLLDNGARRRLCNLIINNELKDTPERTITSSRLYQLAFEIPKVFKKESSAVYFIPFASYSPNQKISAKGKLLDCFRQKRREFIKCGMVKTKERRCSSSSVSSSEPLRPATSTRDALLQLTDNQESDIDEKILWLKNCCDPWETVENYWSVTTKYRLELLQKNCTIQQYFNDFKPLSLQGGIFLLLKDYKTVYPDNDQKLIENWILIRPKIIILAKKRPDAFLKETLKDIESANDEKMDIAAFAALPFLMTTSNVSKTKSKTKALWRPSKQEVLEGFITHVKSAAEIEETIALRIKKLSDFNLTMQPFIIIVGPTFNEISARYIVVNNIRYEVTSILKAVDACFKIIFVLNAQYPAESAIVWQFIQTALFQVKTKFDKTYTTVNTLFTDLNIQRE